MAPAIQKSLQFAWLEYQHHGDAVVFSQQFSSKLGGQNLFQNVPSGPSISKIKNIKSTPQVGMEVKLLSYGKSQGWIGMPKSGDETFLGKWILNPGLDTDTLTENVLITNQADLIIVSGHGAGGTVWGDGLKKGTTESISLAKVLSDNASQACSGKMIFLVIATCWNVFVDTFELWEAVMRKPSPILGIFGYERTYSGGNTGAKVMESFCTQLKKNPSKTILNTWKDANTPFGQPWACFLHKGMETFTFKNWLDGTFPSITPSANKIFHYGKLNPAGVEAKAVEFPYKLRFVMENGIAVNRANNYQNNTAVGLFPGEKGQLLIETVPGTPALKKGDTINFFLFRYRYDKKGAKIDKLLKFDASLLSNNPSTGKPVVTLKANLNPWSGDPSGTINGILITVPSDGTSLLLPYKILSTAHSHFDQDGSYNSYGRFVLGMFEPNKPVQGSGPPPIYAYNDGAQLW